MPIEVFIDSKGVMDMFHGLMRRIPIEKKGIMRDIARVYRDSLRSEAIRAFNYPTGKLTKLIVAKKMGDGWAVTMPSYGRFVDAGRRPGRMPPFTPEIRQWAASSGIDPFWLRRSIGRYGTRPRPFISSGMIRASSRIPRVLKRHALKIIGGR